MLPRPEAPRQEQRSNEVGNILRGRPECKSQVIRMAQFGELDSRLTCQHSRFDQTELTMARHKYQPTQMLVRFAERTNIWQNLQWRVCTALDTSDNSLP